MARLATITGKNGKPSIIIDNQMRIWLGNESDASQTWQAGELFGFNTGVFDFKIVRGNNKRDSAGVAWRLSSDLDLISWNKRIMPVCDFLHTCAVSHGLAEVGIPEHTLSPKMHPIATPSTKLIVYSLYRLDGPTLKILAQLAIFFGAKYLMFK